MANRTTQHQFDLHFMQLALDASKNALPTCRPNPPVGCVIVKDNQLLTTGFTKKPGLYHAEADAFAQLIAKPTDELSELFDLTAYVTLEPCSFQGRTPSCAKTLVDSQRFKRIVVATLDPDPRNNGRGISLLKADNIEVDIGILEQQVKHFLAKYLIKT